MPIITRIIHAKYDISRTPYDNLVTIATGFVVNAHCSKEGLY